MNIIVIIGIAAVVLVLFTGIFSLFKGGEFNHKYGNKLMRLRVVLQFGVILLLGLLMWLDKG